MLTSSCPCAWARAAERLEQVLATREANDGPDSTNVAFALNNLDALLGSRLTGT